MTGRWLGSSGGVFTRLSGTRAGMTQGLGSAGAPDQSLHVAFTCGSASSLHEALRTSILLAAWSLGPVHEVEAARSLGTQLDPSPESSRSRPSLPQAFLSLGNDLHFLLDSVCL